MIMRHLDALEEVKILQYLFKQKSKEIAGEFLGRLVLGTEGDEVKVFGATIY